MIHKIGEAWKIPADLLVRPYQSEPPDPYLRRSPKNGFAQLDTRGGGRSHYDIGCANLRARVPLRPDLVR